MSPHPPAKINLIFWELQNRKVIKNGKQLHAVVMKSANLFANVALAFGLLVVTSCSRKPSPAAPRDDVVPVSREDRPTEKPQKSDNFDPETKFNGQGLGNPKDDPNVADSPISQMWRRIKMIPQDCPIGEAYKLLKLPEGAEVVNGGASSRQIDQTYRLPLRFDKTSGKQLYWYLTVYSVSPSAQSQDVLFSHASIYYDSPSGRTKYHPDK